METIQGDIDRTIRWDNDGSSIEIVKAIHAGEYFSVITKGTLATVLAHTMGASPNMGAVQIQLMLGIAIIAALTALAAFAIAKGYKVVGRTRGPFGDEYEVVFEPTP